MLTYQNLQVFSFLIRDWKSVDGESISQEQTDQLSTHEIATNYIRELEYAGTGPKLRPEENQAAADRMQSGYVELCRRNCKGN